ncbi:MAG: hypothetical protein AAFR11_10975 [Pseudomonadota bacterium]
MSTAEARTYTDSRQVYSSVFLHMLEDQIKRALMANEPFSLVFAKLETYEDLRYAIGDSGLATAGIVLRDAFNGIIGASGWFCNADDQGTNAIVLPSMRCVDAAITAERIRREALSRSALVEETGYLVKQAGFCFGVGEYQGQSARDFTTDIQNALYKSMVSSAYKVAVENPKYQKVFLARLKEVGGDQKAGRSFMRKRVDEIVSFFGQDSLVATVQMRGVASSDYSALEAPDFIAAVKTLAQPVYGADAEFIPARNGFGLVFCSIESEPSELETTRFQSELADLAKSAIRERSGRNAEANIQLVDNLVRTRPNSFISDEEFKELDRDARMRLMLESLQSLDRSAVEVLQGLSSKRRSTSNVLIGYSSRYRERMEIARGNDVYFANDPFNLLIDIACLRRAVQLARDHLKNGLFQTCTVHLNMFNLMDKEYRDLLEIELRSISQISRRLVDFSIVRTGRASSVEDVRSQIGYLKEFARRVHITTSTGADAPFDVFECDADGVGFFIDARMRDEKGVREQIGRIKKLTATNKANLPVLLLGLPKGNVDQFLEAVTPEFFTIKPDETLLPLLALET